MPHGACLTALTRPQSITRWHGAALPSRLFLTSSRDRYPAASQGVSRFGAFVSRTLPTNPSSGASLPAFTLPCRRSRTGLRVARPGCVDLESARRWCAGRSRTHAAGVQGGGYGPLPRPRMLSSSPHARAWSQERVATLPCISACESRAMRAAWRVAHQRRGRPPVGKPGPDPALPVLGRSGGRRRPSTAAVGAVGTRSRTERLCAPRVAA